MHTIEHIKQNGLESLAELGISVKNYPEEGLYVLNYSQIDSPDTHPVVMECRGLILDHALNVVSRSLDRFFNYGQHPDTQISLDISKAVVMDKIDGSLIKIYYWNGLWRISTRGTAFAESKSNGFDLTFHELVLKALNCVSDEEFQHKCGNWLISGYTYIGELTCVENRVVKRYEGYSLWFIACRENTSDYYVQPSKVCLDRLGFKQVKTYFFSSLEECVETAKHLKDLDEGYVLWQEGDNGLTPLCKIKSPAYVAVHHIRGEGLSPKRIMQLVLINEHQEYLNYFPEDEKFFIPYKSALDALKILMYTMWSMAEGVEDQKEFALQVKDFPFSAILFQKKKTKEESLESIWNKTTENYKMKVLEQYVSIEEVV